MIIRYLTAMAGDSYTRNVGDVREVPDAEAGRLIEAGFAEAVKADDGEKEEPKKKKGK